MSGEYSQEIEITPEMRQAGAEVIESLGGTVSSEFLAAAVYSAMADLATSLRKPQVSS